MTPSRDQADVVTVGVHLPQAGPAASGESMQRAALLAEELGFADVWFSDHLAVPVGASYPPSAYVYEPLTAMAFVGAVTKRVALGTTVLVLPMRNPLFLAKALASLDQMTDGRVILGAAAGWLEAEFAALGVPFADRGARTDEAIEIMRTAWSQDPITRDFPVHGASFSKMRTMPHPTHDIPIWIGGHAPVALRRATRVGDGWHGAFLTAEETAERVRFLRSERPDPAFRISMRTGWDPLLDDHDIILGQLDDLVAAGVTHFVPEPRQRTIDDYLRSIEQLAKLLQSAGLAMDAA